MSDPTDSRLSRQDSTGDRMTVIAHKCFACHGTGEFAPCADEPMTTPVLTCAECNGTGVDVEALSAAYQGAVDALREIAEHPVKSHGQHMQRVAQAALAKIDAGSPPAGGSSREPS